MAETQRTSYKTVIKTNGGKPEAATKAEVFLQLVGKDEIMTNWEKLTSFWSRRFRQGSIDEFELTMKNVGMPVLIRLKIQSRDSDAMWGCDYVRVTYNDETEEFPVHDWITDSIEAESGKGVLPQNVDEEFILKSRNNEKGRSKSLYRWANKEYLVDNNWKMPRQLDVNLYSELPAIFKYDERFINGSNKRRINEFKWISVMEKLKVVFFGFKTLEDYNRLHEKLESRFLSVQERWKDDDEFGRHMLNGSSKSIKRCRGLPSHCKVKDNHVRAMLPEGKTLDEEIVKGHIYIVDPGAFSPHCSRTKINEKTELYCPDAIALFYSSAGKFLPIAIQLDPHDEDSIFTPKDEEYDWLLAKMFFKCAEFNNNEHGNHFTTHVVVGAIAVALFRCLPRCHPMHKLLRPHLNLVMAANRRGMDFLFARRLADKYRSLDVGDQANECYRDFIFDDLNFRQRMQRRGLMDPELLPNFHFRDDALLYWDAIDKFTANIINHYYKSDNDIRDDYELQDWINEIVVEGYTHDSGMKTTCPKCFKAKSDLQLFATMVIFTASVYHASVHFPQYEMYKFIPNAPAGMRQPIHKKGEGSLERILETLPDLDMSILQVGTSYVAAGLDENEILLGQYPARYFTEPEPLAMLREFSNDIKEIGEIIKQRNVGREHPYEYLLPENIPATISQ